jgi:hypothetical protein
MYIKEAERGKARERRKSDLTQRGRNGETGK